MWQISLAVCVTLSLVVMTVLIRRHRLPPVPPVFFWLTTAFLGYGFLQTQPVADYLPFYFSEVTRVRQEFGHEPSVELENAANVLAVSAENLYSLATSSGHASLITHESRWALVPFVLAAVMGWLASVLFTTRQSRKVFLWSLLLNTAMLSAWGIVQRASGGVDLLPGIPNPYKSSPFASFIYRNAGAAAILPGIAAAMALFYTRLASQADGGIAGRPSVTYTKQRRWLTAMDLTILAFGSLVLVGVIVSFSRGAWIATAVAGLIVTLAFRRELRWSRVLAISALILGIGSIGVAQITGQLQQRIERLGIDEITLDERWEHWRDGLATAIAYFPSGSGIGTYGHAVLLHQAKPRNGWFREAHNQYLEVATESGMIGLVLLALLICFIVNACWKLRPRRVVRSAQREQQAWGLFGIAILVFGVVQSAVDFVLVIPANLMLYGCMLGILARVARESTSFSREAVSSSIAKPRLATIKSVDRSSKLGSDLTWRPTLVLPAVAGICVWFAVVNASEELQGDTALQLTQLNDIPDRPTATHIQSQIDTLDAAIATQSDRGALYRHRAMWKFALYRSDIVTTAASSGESVPWSSTRPESLFQILAILPKTSREVTIAAMTTPELSPPLVSAILDLASSIDANPVFMQSHLTVACLADVISVPVDRWLQISCELAKCNPDNMYMTGLLAATHGATATMNRQWSGCLEIDPSYSKAILPLAMQREPPLQVAKNTVPLSRPEIMVELVRTLITSMGNQSPQSDVELKQLASQIAEVLSDNPTLSEARKNATAATAYDLVGSSDMAAKHWLAAIDADPRNSTYRLKAAEQLRAKGEFSEALRHVVLGNTLSPNDIRFERLARQIRTTIAKQAPSSP